jgi:hypothetical protein
MTGRRSYAKNFTAKSRASRNSLDQAAPNGPEDGNAGNPQKVISFKNFFVD